MPRAKRRPPRSLWLAAALLLGGAAAYVARARYLESIRVIKLAAGKAQYLHYELVDIALSTKDPAVAARWRQSAPEAVVRRDGRDVTTIAGVTQFPLTESDGAWRAKWAVPWNASTGTYQLALVGQDDLKDRLSARSFAIIRRKPQALPRALTVLTLETDRPLEGMVVTGPDGKKTDWRGLLDWAQYVHADAFWMLGGQTPGPGQDVWVSYNFAMIPKVAEEAHKRGLKFGVYAECYLTMTKDGRQVGGYEYARDAAEGRTFVTRAISLRDPKRPRDVAALLKKFRDIAGVDYLGLDYIRNPLGGYELADDFFAEMPGVHPPREWPRLTEEERMVWFARKKIMRRDDAFIDAWQWWRAHKVGGIVRGIKDQLGDKTPLWAFTLTWDKGWNHGQDPVMMNDAGVDADALMMYEADKDQYAAIVSAFHKYVHRGDVQLIVGDIVDWPLHQKDPAGPKEFYRRLAAAEDGIYADGPAYGVFFHDAGRALAGRLGPWGTRGWLDQARRAADRLKAKTGPAIGPGASPSPAAAAPAHAAARPGAAP